MILGPGHEAARLHRSPGQKEAQVFVPDNRSSACCSALPLDEIYESPYGAYGRCARCKEMAMFVDPDAVPTPGSDEALELGCRCPVVDNGHGRRQDGRFTMSLACPLHGEGRKE